MRGSTNTKIWMRMSFKYSASFQKSLFFHEVYETCKNCMFVLGYWIYTQKYPWNLKKQSVQFFFSFFGVLKIFLTVRDLISFTREETIGSWTPLKDSTSSRPSKLGSWANCVLPLEGNKVTHSKKNFSLSMGLLHFAWIFVMTRCGIVFLPTLLC